MPTYNSNLQMAMLLFWRQFRPVVVGQATANELSEPAHEPPHLFVNRAFLAIDLCGSQRRIVGYS